LETPAHACNIQSYTPTSDVPLEPFKPSWSQIWGLYDPYTQGDALENDTVSAKFDTHLSYFFVIFPLFHMSLLFIKSSNILLYSLIFASI
jgi:hypothetical protein